MEVAGVPTTARHRGRWGLVGPGMCSSRRWKRYVAIGAAVGEYQAEGGEGRRKGRGPGRGGGDGVMAVMRTDG